MVQVGVVEEVLDQRDLLGVREVQVNSRNKSSHPRTQDRILLQAVMSENLWLCPPQQEMVGSRWETHRRHPLGAQSVYSMRLRH